MNAIPENVKALVDECGFDCAGTCPADALVVRQEVRDMCAADKCSKYDTCWACPPGCGDLDYYRALIASRTTCLILQTVAELEDEFDAETMMEAAQLNRERFERLQQLFSRNGIDVVTLASGTCTLCPTCTYPDAPCRFPERRMVSMEAAGLVVNEVCESADVPYYHGPLTITYTGCILL